MSSSRNVPKQKATSRIVRPELPSEGSEGYLDLSIPKNSSLQSPGGEEAKPQNDSAGVQFLSDIFGDDILTTKQASKNTNMNRRKVTKKKDETKCKSDKK